MAGQVDALTSPTLKHLRERWWDTEFSEFLRDTLRPRPGTRVLDVGCGEGTAELSLGRLQVSQVALFAIDRRLERVKQTAAAGAAHNIRLKVAAADALHLPFASDVFDSTFCVAVLQHVPDVPQAIAELARVTRPGGKVIAVEPDNAARYWFSSLESGRAAYDAAVKFFAAAGRARGDGTDPTVGPKLPTLFSGAGVEPQSVHLFPVSLARMDKPPDTIWAARREAVQSVTRGITAAEVTRLAAEYRSALDRYADEAAAAGPGFVEIQHTMLFAVVGQKAAHEEA